jgi:hypothetical protein
VFTCYSFGEVVFLRKIEERKREDRREKTGREKRENGKREEEKKAIDLTQLMG